MLPEGTRLDVVDEADGREVHVGLAVVLYDDRFGDVAGLGGALDGALCGHRVVVVDRTGELCGAEYVGHESVVVQTPDSVRAGRLQGVSQDEFSHNPQISVLVSYVDNPRR